MNEIQILREAIDVFTSELIVFCKPFMQQKEVRSQVAKLLSSESNLRLTIEYACDAQTADDCKNKLILTLEELNTISENIKSIEAGNTEQKHALLYRANEIVADLKEILDRS